MSASDDSASATPRFPTPPEQDRERLFRLSLDLLCTAGPEGYFRQVNPSWSRVLGWSEAELLAHPIDWFIHPDDLEHTRRIRAGMFAGDPARNIENRYRCKDGSYRWLSWQSSVPPGTDTVYAVARDITERRQIEHERMVLSKLESTALLAGGIAHDFNNLLASLLLNLELVSLTGPVNSLQQSHLEQARVTVHSARTLTDRLLAFAQGSSANRRVMDLRPLVQRAIDLTLPGSRCQAELHFDPELWPVEIDEGQINEVLRQLLLNARDAMPAGGKIQVRATNLRLTTAFAPDMLPGDYLSLTIQDEGPGIPAEVLPRIFDPYFSTKQRGVQKGMGLGLTICHTVLQKHGGIIKLSPVPAGGTSVTCYLPVPRPDVAIKPSSTSAAAHPGKRLLVMDDEPSLRDILHQALLCLGYSVEIASDGPTAVALHTEARQSSSPFAAVLLDLTVHGGLGGAEVLRVLRASDPALRAIIMSDYHQEELFRDPARHGFDAALAKPFSMDRLKTVLTEVLGTPPPATR